MLNKDNIRFEFKTIGVNILISMVLMFIPLVFMIILNLPYEDVNVIQLSEIFILISSAWICIFSFKELLCENILELLLTYPNSDSNLGNSRVKKIYTFFLVLLFVYTSIISFLYKEIDFIQFFIQFALEGLFILYLSLLFVLYSKNASFSITFIIIYILLMYTMGQDFFSYINIMLYNTDTLPVLVVLGSSIRTILFTIIAYKLSSYKLSKIYCD